MLRLRFVPLCLLLLIMAGPGGLAARASDMMEDTGWEVAETVGVYGHSPRHSIRLYELGEIDAFGLRPIGGDAHCHIVEGRMADHRRFVERNLALPQDEITEFDLYGTNTRVQSVVFSCNPRFGVTGLQLEILVR